MITEDYVSFETAKLLKEKGFDGPCFRYAESKEIYESGNWTVSNVTGGGIGVPTLQMAWKWLVEEHGIVICPDICSQDPETGKVEKWVFNYWHNGNYYNPCFEKENMFYGPLYGKHWATPEEMLNEAIVFCLDKWV